jgi:hypothetical protein
VAEAAGYDAQTVPNEVRRIVADLTDPPDPDGVPWGVWPLRDDDDSLYRPEYLDGGVPRFWWVSVQGRGQAVDLTAPSAIRIYFLADMAQDKIIEESTQARPWCPVHRRNMLNVRLEEDSVYWQCPDDEAVRCDVGGYWPWRRAIEG